MTAAGAWRRTFQTIAGLSLACLSALMAAAIPDCLEATRGAGSAGVVAVAAVALISVLGYIAGAALAIFALKRESSR